VSTEQQPDLARSDDGEDAQRREPTFGRAWRGFDRGQVTHYLDTVSTSVQSLESRVRKAEAELREARRERDAARQALEASARPDPFEGVSTHVAQLVRSFDEQVDGLRRDAEVQAEGTLEEVRAEGERILTRARKEGERIAAEARADAERELEDARAEAERIRAEAERIRAEAEVEEEVARSRAGNLIHNARQEADRIEFSMAALKESTLEEFRGIRDRTLAALGELQIAIDGGASSGDVVVIEDPKQVTSTNGSEVLGFDP
jgi:cell division septum initiation protein DivIVA